MVHIGGYIQKNQEENTKDLITPTIFELTMIDGES